MNSKPINKHLTALANTRLESIMKTAIALASMLPEQIVKNCITCGSFDEEKEICKKFNARPPAKVIAFSCESYDNVDSDIPF